MSPTGTHRVPRFWCRRTAEYRLDGRGYLLDPADVRHGRSLNPEVVATDVLLGQRCTILLGEPGAGKTTTLQEMHEKLQAGAGEDDLVWDHGLGRYDDGRWLVDEVFRARQVEAWKAGSGRLHLLLDGLDECHLLIRQLPRILGDEIQALPADRVHLVVTCRSADWPSSLERRLKATFDDVEVLEVLPLRRTDVEAIARRLNVEPQSFIGELERVGAVPLAIRPLTLGLLIRLYSKGGGALPAVQAELYEQGLSALCDEPPESFRRDAGLLGRLSPAKRMIVAGRLAAITLLSGRKVFWTGSYAEPPPATDIAIGRCDGGAEMDDARPFDVDQTAVREVLRTGLFTSRGPSRVGWAHQSYPEFLAAWYLVHRGLATEQLQSLLTLDPADAVLPQMRSLAAWTAALAPRRLDDLAINDPEAFVGLGVRFTDEELQRRIVEGLLRLASQGRLRQRWGVNYGHLKHAGLAEQLRPFIEEDTRPAEARLLAIDIAGDTQLSALEEALVGIALDEHQPGRHRVTAAYAIAEWGEDASRLKLLPLAEGTVGPYDDDELKGVALRALWPRLLDSRRVFGLVTPPKNQDLAGAYFRFLVSELPEGLTVQHLPEALTWARGIAAAFPRHEDDVHHLDPLLNRIAMLSWQHLDEPSVATQFAEIVLWRARRYEGLFSRNGVDVAVPDDGKRRPLLLAVLRVSGSPVEHAYDLMTSKLRLARPGDFTLLLEEYQRTHNTAVREAFAQLLRFTFNPDDREHAEAVLALDRGSELYKDVFSYWVEPMRLDSEQAARAHELLAKRKPPEEPESSVGEDELRERLHVLLASADGGDKDAWWRLNLWMTVEPGTRYFGDEFQDDLTLLPGWKLLPPDSHTRVYSAARCYLQEGTAATRDWLGTGQVHRPAFAGYRAAALLLRHDQESLDHLSGQHWAEWAGILLDYPVTHDKGDHQVKAALLTRAYAAAPEAVIDAATTLIVRDSVRNQGLFGHRFLTGLWDGRLAEALNGLLEHEGLSDSVFGDVLEMLLDHRHEPSYDLAVKTLNDSGVAMERRLRAAAGLLAHYPEEAWKYVWPTLQETPSFGEELFLRAANHDWSLDDRLSEKALRDLYIWLCQQFPPSDDPQIRGAHVVSRRENLGHWRDNLLGQLTRRGNAASVEAVRDIAARFPSRPWLQQAVLDAQEVYRSSRWTPVEPEELLALLGDPNKRLVRSGEELLRVVIESLHRIQRQLQGETPEARFLWNEGEAQQPKDEDTLSDYVKNRLEADLVGRGIVANREVQVRRRTTGIGERADIRIDAISGDPLDGLDRVTVVVESKGCWHPQLMTSMRSQLYERYMVPIGTRYGVYLVFWFSIVRWATGDPRRARAAALDEMDTEHRLALQANELAAGGASVAVVLLDASLPPAAGT